VKKKILIVSVNWIGDVLFTTPLIRALRDAGADSHIACLIHPRCAGILDSNPGVDELILYDEEGVHRSLAGKMRLISELRKRAFDATFILHRSFTRALIAYLAGIRERIGYATKHRSWLLTLAVKEPPAGTHKVEYFLGLARLAGIELKVPPSYEFYVEDRDRKFASDMLRGRGVGESDRTVILCPGGNWDPKRWPKRNFASLGDMLAERFGLKIVISGAAKDTGLADSIAGMMRVKPVITCGATSLASLAALFEKASLVIANDTGPMHLAVAAGADTIALFGPTSPEITGPYGRGNYRVMSKHGPCEIPCHDFTCKDNRCMAAISVDDVFREAENFLKMESRTGNKAQRNENR
jgi:lipopolysaccharide heptosyltransferase II